MFSIRKSSNELNDASELRWHFPSALSPEAHAEWGLYKILQYMGLHKILPPGAGKNRAKLRKDIEEYHIAYAIDFDDSDIDTFIARRPDGLAFDKEKKSCVFLEYTRAMDTNEDWAEKKEQEKKRQIQLPSRFHQPSQSLGKKRLESLSNQFHNGSTRLSTHQPVPYETGVARGKEHEHARSHTKQNGPKNSFYVGYDPQVFFYCIKLQDRFDTPNPTHRNRQQEHGKI